MKRRDLGKHGELVARDHLLSKGYEIVATNYFCRYGELDIVARDQESLVFVEVKCRKTLSGLEQAIGPKKISSLRFSARSFMQHTGLEDESFRFLVLFVCISNEKHGLCSIEAIEDPF